MNLDSTPFSLDYAKFDVTNPGQTHPSFKGTVGYLLVGIASIPFFWLAGVKGVLFSPISAIWNSQQQRLIAIHSKKINITISELRRNFKAFPLATRGRERLRLKEKIAELKVKQADLQGEVEGLQLDAKRTRQTFVASLLALIPVLGVIFSGVYLRYTTEGIQDCGIRGVVEAIAQKIFTNRGYLIRPLIYPIKGKSEEIFNQIRNHVTHCENRIRMMGGKEIAIPVFRSAQHQSVLKAIAFPMKPHNENFNEANHSFDPTKPVAVIFHGNAEIGKFKVNQAAFYQQIGFNVLAVTMGGFPGSDSTVDTSEITSYQDANAVVKYLKAKGCKDIVVHGTSIGGTLATAAAELHPDVVKFLVADQTLDNIANVAVNLLRNQTKGKAPTALIRGVMKGAFSTGETVPGVYTLEGKPYKTDGLNNLRKTSQLQCEVIAINAEYDGMMARERNGEKFKHNFAEDLILARYGNKKGAIKEAILKDHMLVIPRAPHCAWLDHYDYGNNVRYILDPEQEERAHLDLRKESAFNLARPLRDALRNKFFVEAEAEKDLLRLGKPHTKVLS